MPSRVQMDLIGDREMQKAFSALGSKIERKVMRKALRAAGKVLLAATKAKARSLSRGGGFMLKVAASLKLRALKRSRKGFGVVVMTPGKNQVGLPEKVTRKGHPRHGQPTKHHAPIGIELGSKGRPPLSYMRAAFDETEEKQVATLVKGIRIGIDTVWRNAK